MLIMEFEHRAVALADGANAIGVTLDQVPGKQPQSLVGLADLVVAGAALGQDEIVPLVIQADIKIEFVEACFNSDRSLNIAMLDDAFNRLRRSENRPARSRPA